MCRYGSVFSRNHFIEFVAGREAKQNIAFIGSVDYSASSADKIKGGVRTVLDRESDGAVRSSENSTGVGYDIAERGQSSQNRIHVYISECFLVGCMSHKKSPSLSLNSVC